MPNANDRIEETQDALLRILPYGVAGTKKTWWSMNAASFGFNVIHIDGDDGWRIVNQLDREVRTRITLVNAIDTITEPAMCKFITYFLKGDKFLWDETARIRVYRKDQLNEKHNYVFVDASKLTQNDVVVIDSWKALCTSLSWRFAKENNIDLANPSLDSNWDGYRWAGALANFFLEKMHALPCHVIVIGHETVYEKRDQDKHSNTKGKLIFARQQPISTSGPHGMKLATEFGDVLWFHIQGVMHKIDTRTEQDRDGKTQLVPPADYNWKDLQFDKFCEATKIPLPENAEPCEAFRSIKGTDVVPEEFGLSGGANVTSVVNKTSSNEKPKPNAALQNLLKKG